MIFEVGKHYEHSTGKKMHILGEVNSDMYYSPCLVAEDLEGNFIPIGIGEDYAVNWNEIDEAEWLNELKCVTIYRNKGVMSDLISRSELLKSFQRCYSGHLGMENSDFMMTFKSICKIINQQPTAFDTDKVILELEKELSLVDKEKERCAGENNLQFDSAKGYASGISTAIEIVKQGGVSDDVCEWRCDEYGRYHTECHTLADNDPLEYTYCPYCGKKIKVVE